MRYLIIGLSLIIALSCISLAVQAQPPGYRMECNGNSCRLVPTGPTITSSTTITTPSYSSPSYAVQPPYAVYQTAPTYYSVPAVTYYSQPMYAIPQQRRYVETYRGPFGGTWQRAYSSGGTTAFNGNPACGCVNCRCVNCACGW